MVKDSAGKVRLMCGKYLGKTTNNIAEYRALLHGLQLASRRKPSVLHVRSDSELMVRQILGIYKVRNPGLKPLHAEALTQLRAFPQWNIRHVPRDDNSLADGLANRAIQTHKYSLPGK